MAFLKIAKPGKDILSITDDRDYVFNSEFDYLKESQSGLVDTDDYGNVTITHNKGYVPAFVVFMADYYTPGMWYPYFAMDVYATSTQLVIVGAMGETKSKVYYSIFSSEL